VTLALQACAVQLTPAVGCRSDAECARGELCLDGACAETDASPIVDNEDEDAGFELPGCTLQRFKNASYLFCRQPTSWVDAQSDCSSVGAHIADVRDNGAADLDKLEEAALFDLAPGIDSMWIGLDDRAVEGTFVAPNGVSIDLAEAVRTSRFAAGEPNDGAVGEDCVEVSGGGTWNDQACAVLDAVVCQDVPANQAVEGDCQRSAVNGETFLFCSTRRSAAAADALCRTARGSSLSFEGKKRDIVLAENNAIRARATALGIPQYWLGLTDIDRESQFVWSDALASPLDRAAAVFTEGEPNNSGGTEDCVELTRGGWNDRDCATTLSFFCER
jgi:hypothetical protein